MKYVRWLLCLSITFDCTPALGEFFKYIDQDGTIRFTDDFSKIPKGNKSIGVQEYIESELPANSEAASLQKETDISEHTEAEEKHSHNAKTQDSFDEERSELDTKKQDLLDEYQSLMAEKETLEAKRRSVTPQEVKVVNKKIADLNENIENYEKN